MSLDPTLKIKYKNGQEVEIAWNGDVKNIVYGTIIGIASENILDMWIILLDKRFLNWPYDAVVIPHTFLRLINNKNPFLCVNNVK